jgi:Fic/DOC family
VPPDWDQDSPLLRQNLAEVLEEIQRVAKTREMPACETARRWQRRFLHNLQVPNPRFVGSFRGEPGLEQIAVRVAENSGVEPSAVADELKQFESKLQELISELDVLMPPDRAPDADQLSAIIDVCAWAHAEWIRIHPFANGNGRTARLWANSIALRYGLPPFIRLRPRPDGGYGDAGAKAMRGDWKPTAIAFRRLLNEFLNEN